MPKATMKRMRVSSSDCPSNSESCSSDDTIIISPRRRQCTQTQDEVLPYTSKSAERPQKRRRLRSTSGKRENRKRKHRSKERTPRKHHTRRHHSHDRRRLPRCRVCTSSSEYTDTPGEFETSDITGSQYDSETCNFTDSSDSDYEQFTPPIIPFGSKAGDSVKKKPWLEK